MQLATVIIILALAAAYAGRSAYRALRRPRGGPCAGCPIRDACDRKKGEGKA